MGGSRWRAWDLRTNRCPWYHHSHHRRPLLPIAAPLPYAMSYSAPTTSSSPGATPASIRVNGIEYRTQMAETGSYASAQDLFTFSIAVDDAQSYAVPVVEQWLRLGANKINEWLGQRFTLPLASFSLSIVWANCELAYIGLAKIRGFNTDSDVQALMAREKAVNEWMRLTRDHEITPDKALAIAEQPYQPIRYIGPTLPSWGGSPDGGGGGWGSGNAW